MMLEEGRDGNVRLTDGKDVLRQMQTTSHATGLLGHGLVRLRLAPLDGLLVGLVDQVLPRGRDVGWSAVVGRLEDEQADVKVARRISVYVEHLATSPA